MADSNRIIDDSIKDYPIQPKHISTKSHFWEAFGNMESEVSAWLIVALCQRAGGWVPFTKKEIDVYGKQNFFFNGLCDNRNPQAGNNFVILGEDGRYRVTQEFIAICFKSSPAI